MQFCSMKSVFMCMPSRSVGVGDFIYWFHLYFNYVSKSFPYSHLSTFAVIWKFNWLQEFFQSIVMWWEMTRHLRIMLAVMIFILCFSGLISLYSTQGFQNGSILFPCWLFRVFGKWNPALYLYIYHASWRPPLNYSRWLVITRRKGGVLTFWVHFS